MSSFNTNNLIHCSSPYLQQSAQQPVHWQPWSQETLTLAQQQNKPILLSIGYLGCDLSRKMAQESFCNHQTAQRMNQHFVNILVDREQRADLDLLFQQAHRALNKRSGGWPLTVFLEPKSLLPFFAGTYFAAESLDGQPSFGQLLMTIHDIYHQKYSDVLEMCVAVKQQLQPPPGSRVQAVRPISEAIDSIVSQFIAELKRHLDPEWGGLNSLPKFPHPQLYQTLLNIIIYYRPEDSEQLYQHLMLSAQSQAKIGLYDHLAGGFFRNCIDRHWGIPQFEKRLADNSLLMCWYAALANFNKEGSLAFIAHQTGRWMIDELRLENGLFASALSADNNHAEDHYYLFDKQEIKALLEPEQWELAKVAFGLEQAPNFKGRWHLHCWYSAESLAQKLSLPLKQVQWSLEPIKQSLLEYRRKRTPPVLDPQAICSWNSLLASALFKTGQLIKDESLIETAEHILQTIRTQLWHKPQLWRSYYQDQTVQQAFLDDYSALGQALMDSLSHQWQTPSYNWLEEITEQIINRFYQPGYGLLYTEAAELPIRPVVRTDDSLPNGYALAVHLFSQLTKLTGEARFQEMVDDLFNSSIDPLTESPLAHASLINSLLQHIKQAVIVLRGTASELAEWRAELQPALGKTHLLLAIPKGTPLPDSLEQRYPSKDECYGALCRSSAKPLVYHSVTEIITAVKQF